MTGDLPAPVDQDAVIAFLSDPASHDLHDGTVERIETHCSIVFLAADLAYKLKRAIRYASLDYTTRALREAACAAELRLNRRTAPELYLAVRSINRDRNGVLAFDGPGPALDHVVVMRRFAQSDLLDRLAEAGELTPELMRALGEAVARFHLSAELMPSRGGSEAIRRVIDDNDRELAKVAPELDGAAVGTISIRARAALTDLTALLDRRRAEGKVRRCHGDLRLANICRHDGRPTLFDCIEFSEEIGCIDVLYDLAFLLMDLHLLGRGDLGNAVFNAYLDLTPETEGLRALPLFLALRAATRSYALAGGARRRANPRQAARRLASARHHINAGIAFLAPRASLLIAVGGDDDLARRDFAAALAAACAPPPGARGLHVAPLRDVAWQEASGVLAAGCSVVIEGAFSEQAERDSIDELASRLDVRLLRFWYGGAPGNVETGRWRTLDPVRGVLDAVVAAAPLISERGAASHEPVISRT